MKLFYALIIGLVLPVVSAAETVRTANTSLTLQVDKDVYVYTHSGTGTWTLPAVAGNKGETFTVINRGSANLTLQRAGSDNIYTTTTVTSIVVAPGDKVDLQCDGTYWVMAGLRVGTDVQAYDADLTTYAGITPSANVQTLLGSASYSAFATSLGLGTGSSPTFAGLSVAGNISTTAGGNRLFTVNRSSTTDYARFMFQTNSVEKYALGMRGDSSTNDELNLSDANFQNVGRVKQSLGVEMQYPLATGLSKTLTESSATAFVQVGVSSNSSVGGIVYYRIHASDASDYQCRTGQINFSIVNKGGTETATIGTVVNEAAAVSAGTLTVTFDTDTSPTNAVNLRANAVSSLTQTTLAMTYYVVIAGPAALVTPQ